MIHNWISSRCWKIIANRNPPSPIAPNSRRIHGNFTGVFIRAFIQRFAGRFLVREIALADWIANERGRETERGPMALRHWHSPTIVSRVFIGFRCVFVQQWSARVTVTCANSHVSVTLFRISLVVSRFFPPFFFFFIFLKSERSKASTYMTSRLRMSRTWESLDAI